MRSQDEVAAVLGLLERGLNDCEIARLTDVPRETVRDWRRGMTPRTGGRRRARGEPAGCPACGHPPHAFDQLPAERYAYLLGLYLGDGSIVAHRRGVLRFGVTLDARYPRIVDECAAAIGLIIGKEPGRAARPGCVHVNAYSKQWPCLFPQHGTGPKHKRPIALVDWQQRIVDDHPRSLLRGLIQSDGCRVMNRVTVRAKQYAYRRYQFSNASDDIRAIFCQACDAVGVEWRRMNARNISVAKRASVELLDEFVGPKR